MTTLSSFLVSDVILKLAEQENLNLQLEGIDDICYGCVIDGDISFASFIAQHALPYNWQILDGDPIRLVRRAVNDGLVIDFEIAQEDCIPGSNGAPAVSFKRIATSDLPRQVTIQYTDPDRQFAKTERSARHPGAPTNNSESSIPIDFVITADLAREMAYDTLYRIWSQRTSCSFIHPDITIEPGDVCRVTCDQGVYTVLVVEANYTVNRTTSVIGTVLLTAAGVTLAGGGAGDVPVDILVQNISANFSGSGGMRPIASGGIGGIVTIAATFHGAGGLSVLVAGGTPQSISATFAGSGNLSAYAAGPKVTSVTFGGRGTMRARSGAGQQDISARFVGNSSLLARGSTPQQIAATFDARGNLTASTDLPSSVEVTLSGAGNVRAQADVNLEVAFSASLSITNGVNTNSSFRQVVSPMVVAAGGTLARVTFTSGNTGTGLKLDKASIGTQSTTYNTTATPVELLFGGVSGFDIGINTTITSDWVPFSTIADANAVVIGDVGLTGTNSYKSVSTGVPSCVLYTQLSSDTYNIANPAGSWTTQTGTDIVAKVEVSGNALAETNAVAFAGQGNLSVFGNLQDTQSAMTFAGQGNTSIRGRLGQGIAGTLAGSGSLRINATLKQRAPTTFQGAGAVSALGVINP